MPQIGSNCVVAWQASSQADLVVPIPGMATVDGVGWVVWTELDWVLLELPPPPHENPPI